MAWHLQSECMRSISTLILTRRAPSNLSRLPSTRLPPALLCCSHTHITVEQTAAQRCPRAPCWRTARASHYLGATAELCTPWGAVGVTARLQCDRKRDTAACSFTPNSPAMSARKPGQLNMSASSVSQDAFSAGLSTMHGASEGKEVCALAPGMIVPGTAYAVRYDSRHVFNIP